MVRSLLSTRKKVFLKYNINNTRVTITIHVLLDVLSFFFFAYSVPGIVDFIREAVWGSGGEGALYGHGITMARDNKVVRPVSSTRTAALAVAKARMAEIEVRAGVLFSGAMTLTFRKTCAVLPDLVG